MSPDTLNQVITAVVAVVAVPLALLGYIYGGEWLIERLPEGSLITVRRVLSAILGFEIQAIAT